MTTMNPVIAKDIKEILSRPLEWERFRNSTVLITGAAGMIPSYVVYLMVALNDQLGLGINVLALVRNEQKAREILAPVADRPEVHFLVQDVCQPLNYEGNIDYIFHGGSAARPSAHQSAPTDTIRANLMGTFNLLDAAVTKKCSQFVLFSSSEVYGTVPKDLVAIGESDYGYIDILNPRSCYSEGKRAAETIASTYAQQFGVECKMVRFGHIYGPGLALDDGRVQADFAAHVMRDEDIVMNSDGSAVRAYTYVSDAVAGMMYVVLNGADMAYNVADSNGVVSIRELAEAFVNARPEKGLTVTCKISEDCGRMYNPATFIALSDRKLKDLGWSARVVLNEGVSRMLSYYESQISSV